MTAAEVKTMCDSLSLADVEAMAASQERLVQKRADHGWDLDGAADRLWLIREYLKQRTADDEG